VQNCFLSDEKKSFSTKSFVKRTVFGVHDKQTVVSDYPKGSAAASLKQPPKQLRNQLA